MDSHETNVSTWPSAIGTYDDRTSPDDPLTLTPYAATENSSPRSTSPDPVPDQTPDIHSNIQTWTDNPALQHDPSDQFADHPSIATPFRPRVTVLECLQSLINTSGVARS